MPDFELYGVATGSWQSVVAQTRAFLEPVLTELAPGIWGVVIDLGARGLYISYVESRDHGSRAFVRWLDSLPTNRRLVGTSVVNPKLARMLARRGWRPSTEWVAEYGVECAVWERLPTTILPGGQLKRRSG